MKFLYLKIAVAVIAFSLGIGGVWAFGGFSYLATLMVRDAAVSEVPAPTEQIPLEPIATENQTEPVHTRLFNFGDFPVTEFYSGKKAKLILAKREIAIYGEKLQYTIQSSGVDFAGRYIVANWSCGMWCSWSAIIDAKTGKVYGWDGLLSPCFPDLDKDFACDSDFSNVEYRSIAS